MSTSKFHPKSFCGINGAVLMAVVLCLPLIVSGATFLNPGFVYETPDLLTLQPDLDGDGMPDLVVVNKSTGIIRTGMFENVIHWLEPVPGGISPVTGLASGPVEAPTFESIVLAGPKANRLHLFSLDGGGLNPVPRVVYNDLFGVSELAAVEEPNSGTPTTIELVGYSGIYDFSVAGVRDFLTQTGSGLESYDPGFSRVSTFPERAYRRVMLEPGLMMLGFIQKDVGSGLDSYILIDTNGGGFDIISDVLVPGSSNLTQASFDTSGAFQFIFHVPGEDVFICYTWNGSNLDPVDNFLLNVPASRLVPYISDKFVGFFAVRMDGSKADFYSFDGFSAPELVDSLAPSSSASIGAVTMLPNGRLLMLSGPDSDPAAFGEIFEYDGNFFSPIATSPVPSLESIHTGSNVLLFSADPLVDDEAPLTGRLGTGVWTSAVSIGGTVDVTKESYGGEAGGLGSPVPVNLGSPPAGTTDGLGNQVDLDVALYDNTTAFGEIPGTIVPQPDPGSYSESITVDLIPSVPGTKVFYRVLPSGGWEVLTNQIGPFFEGFSLEYFGDLPSGARTRIQSVNYDILTDPTELDSDKDGVPDYVEISNGLDPVHSGDDGDGDGFSDRLELMVGTDPANDSSVPPSRENDADGDGFTDLEEELAGTLISDPGDYPDTPGVLNFQSVYDLIAVPYSHDGATGYVYPSLDEALEVPGGDPLATTMRLYEADGSLVGFDRTALHGLGNVVDPSSYFDEVPIGDKHMWQVVATEANFQIDIVDVDQNRGRQIAGLVPFPSVELPQVTYVYGSSGGNPTTESNAWIAAARSHYLSLSRPQVVSEINLMDTLVLLLVELKVENILHARGVLTGDSITLTGFRSSESAVPMSEAPGDGSSPVMVPINVLQDLRHRTPGVDDGYYLGDVLGAIQSGLESMSRDVGALRAVATEIYRLSAAEANTAPGSMLPPLDALRQFVRTGSLLNTGYLSDPEAAPLNSANLSNASSGVIALIDSPNERVVDTWELTVTPDSFGGACTLLDEDGSGQTLSLLNHYGDPYLLPNTFSLPIGTVLHVEGYLEASTNCWEDFSVEVIPPVSLVSLPVTGSIDLDGDLIPDQVEELYPLEMDTFGDSDSDGFSDLQEILDGTNPFDPSGFPEVSPADLGPPVVNITQSGGTQWVFNFKYPETYADEIDFRLYSGPNLHSMNLDSGFDAVHLGGGVFQLTINKPAGSPVFFRFKLHLPGP